MDYNSFVQEIGDKYNYDIELRIAIRLSLPLMVEKYGNDKIQDICNLFRNTRIFSSRKMDIETQEKIESEMTQDINKHVNFIEENPYQNNDDPGSYYSFVPIIDENDNVIGEKKWIVVKDMKDEVNGSKYKELFGTSINMPYFIHEINHAFAMQDPIYVKKGNIISSKHGMYRKQMEINSNDEYSVVTTIDSKNLLIEEGINEKYTQDMLTKLMNKENYEEVVQELDAIHHVNSTYSSTLINLSDKLIDLLGDDKIYQYRNKNNMQILKEFNEKASKSAIAQTYCNGDKPFDYFDKKCFAIFCLASNGYKLPIETFATKVKELTVEGFTPLCAYQDIEKGTMPKDKFDKIKESILGTEIEKTSSKPVTK